VLIADAVWILMCKLDIFADEIEARQTVTARYAGALASRVLTPTVPDHAVSVCAQYTVRIPDGRRDEFAAKLKAAGVPTAINYPKPLHPQTAYRHFPGWLVDCIAAPLGRSSEPDEGDFKLCGALPRLRTSSP
jgi:dTDP-4-amino-4,6-dideoxygalactose transaminase